MAGPQWHLLVGVLVTAGLIAVTLYVKRRRSQKNSSIEDVSVPEALHALAHGPRKHRALAARALTEILNGEVQVLEEVLDEAREKHPEYGIRRSDGRTVLGMVIDGLAERNMTANDAEAEAFVDLLLQCTFFDPEWDETDEWNELALEAVAHLRDVEGAEERLARAEKLHVGGAVGSKAAVLRQRLSGDKTAKAPPAGESLPTPGMLSMNTRVSCPVCMSMKEEPLRCPRCRNVGYCCADHLRADAERHGTWCFGGSESEASDG